MDTSARRAGRLIFAVVLIVLALGHVLFALANFGFVERLPDNLDVLIEGIAASIAAGSLFWGAINHIRGTAWAAFVVVGGCAFAAGMLLSVVTQASTPTMLLVVIPILSVGVGAMTLEKAKPRSTA